eukprot:7376122-Prymnesium_polylepis.3
MESRCIERRPLRIDCRDNRLVDSTIPRALLVPNFCSLMMPQRMATSCRRSSMPQRIKSPDSDGRTTGNPLWSLLRSMRRTSPTDAISQTAVTGETIISRTVRYWKIGGGVSCKKGTPTTCRIISSSASGVSASPTVRAMASTNIIVGIIA